MRGAHRGIVAGAMSPRWRRRVWPVVPALLVLAAFALRTVGLGQRSLWYDEGYTVWFAQQDVGGLIAQAARLEINTPLHYLLLHGWMIGAGASEFAVRLLSVSADVVTVALIYRLAQMAAHRRAAPWCAAVAALWPASVSLAQETRMYALAVCLSTLSLALLVAGLASDFRRRGILLAWCASAVAAFSAHVLAFFVVAAESLIVLAWWLFRSPRPRARVVPGAIAGVNLALAGWVLYLLSQAVFYGTTYAVRLDYGATLVKSLAALILPRLLPVEGTAVAACAAGAILAAAAIPAAGKARLVPVCAALSLAGIAAFGALTGKFAGRYAAIVAPWAAASLGLVLYTAGTKWSAVASPWAAIARAAAGLSVYGACAAGLIAWWTLPVYANDDFRGAAQHIRANIAADEAVLLVSGHMAPVFAYYSGPAGWYALPDDPVLNIYHALDYAAAVPALNQALAGRQGAWLVLWQDDLADPTAITQALLRRQSIGLTPQLDTDRYHGIRLQHYRFFQAYQPLPAAVSTGTAEVQLTDRQRGLGASGCIQFVTPRAGDGFLELACFWSITPGTSLPATTQVSLRLTDAGGTQVLQSDQVIAPRGLPYIPYDKPIAGFYNLPLPPDLPAGAYTLRVIPYTADEQISPNIVLPVRISPK